jgi:hypothetical protein
MRTVILAIAIIFVATVTHAQTIVAMNGDTVQLQDVYKDQNRIVIFVNSGSCTGCKDQLNGFLSKNDTAVCKIIIVRELATSAGYLKRQMKADVNNYFTKYDLLLFQFNTPENRNPYVITIDRKNTIKRFSYDELYEGIFLTELAQQQLLKMFANK